MSDKRKMIDDLIAQLDKSMSSGVGHMNIKVEDQSILLEKFEEKDNNIVKEVEVLGCLECQGNMACGVPTLMEGLDDKTLEKENDHD